jgi:HTH-type transcriptional regulator/antitoxin HigA
LALQAWQARVLHLAANQSLPPFSRADLTLEFIRDVLKLSSLTTGPILAQERLQQRGLPLVILPHLPRTYLDGACFNSTAGRPVVGLTLRHDRLDNFWFTLAHELAHVFLHLDSRDVAFFDNTERNETVAATPQETEANALASELLIPAAIWQREKPALNSKAAIAVLANQLTLSPAIVAGRLRWEANNYNNFDELLGRKTVRKLFVVEA